MKLLLVFSVVLGLASAGDLAAKQQAINRLLEKVTEPIQSYYTELKEAAETWDPRAHKDNCEDGGKAVEELLGEIEAGRVLKQHAIFSLFHDRHREEAIMLIHVLLNCKDFKTFINNAAYFREKMNEGEFVYALYVAVTHSELTTDVVLPPLYEVTPHLFTNSEIINKAYSAKMTQTPGKFKMEFTGSKTNPEQSVAYFGEDIGMNSHHVHWHMDFPFWWDGHKIDRKGELFFWAHHQLTARFDAERLSNHLPVVDELYWDRPIYEGFAPHTTYRYGGEFPSRPDNKFFEDVDGVARIRDMKIIEDRIHDAIDHGYIVDRKGNQIALDEEHGIDILGDIIESSTYSPNVQYYGALHNTAHKMLGRQADPHDKFNLPPGVMEHFETATRDPSFFRLHKYMNNIFKDYKNTLPPYTAEELGYANAQITDITVEGELATFFEDYEFSLINAIDDTESIDDVDISAYVSRLNHHDFSYKIGVKANADEPATVRIYLCPKQDSNGVEYTLDEARWGCILLDKFWTELSAGDNTIVRKSSESSVTIPFRTRFATLIKEADEAVESGSDMVKHNARACGLPQSLLLPKGNIEGVDFELFVSITSGDDAVHSDLVSNDHGGSYSYCGIKRQDFPDKRAMGYPLDRKVVDSRLFKQPNIKWVTVKVFHHD
ncbi:Hemocyanin C-terminal, partial [Trinorchestia longiramus]